MRGTWDEAGEGVTRDVVIRLHEDGAPPERMTAMSSTLRSELLQLDVDDVRPARSATPTPAGARAGDAASVSDLVVTIATSTAVLSSIASIVTAWVSRGGSRKATISLGDKSLSLEGLPVQEQQRLVEAFLQALPER